MKKTWGGTREGAGRKSSPSRLSQIQSRVALEIKAWYQDEAEQRGVSVSALVAQSLKEWAAQSNNAMQPTGVPNEMIRDAMR